MSTVQGGPGNIVKNGLILNLDAANPRSYPPPYNGTTWFDLSGNNYNGTLVNGPIYSTTNGGNFLFDGIDDYVNNTFTNPFAETIVVWARSATSTWNENGWMSSSRSQNGHLLHPLLSSKDMRYYIIDSSSVVYYMGAVTPTSIIIPHMYAYTTNGSNLHRGYYDGNIVVENTTSIVRTNTPTPQTWWLGRDTFGIRYGNGNIYLVLRYNRELTPQEINQNFQATRARFGI